MLFSDSEPNFQKLSFRKSWDKSHPSHSDTSVGTQQSILIGFERNEENAHKVQISFETSGSTKNTLLAWPITLHLSKWNKKVTHTFPRQNFKWILEDLCTWQLFGELGAPDVYCSILNELIKVVCCYFLQKHFHSLRKNRSPKRLIIFKGMTLSYSCSHYILYTP